MCLLIIRETRINTSYKTSPYELIRHWHREKKKFTTCELEKKEEAEGLADDEGATKAEG